MADVNAIKDYFKKLQKAVNEEAEFTFFSFKFAKKNRVDDLLCCILALLPDSFKKALKKHSVTTSNQLISVSAYKRMEKLIKRPFPLSPDIYMVRYSEVLSLFKAITVNIERDINNLEQY